jgi:hypothetical protein
MPIHSLLAGAGRTCRQFKCWNVECCVEFEYVGLRVQELSSKAGGKPEQLGVGDVLAGQCCAGV